MEINRENLLAFIRSELDTKHLSISGLEKQSGVPKDTIRDFLRGKTQVLRADKLQKILRVLKPEKKVPLTGTVGVNAEIKETASSSNGFECPPGYAPEELNAVMIEGDALTPLFYSGWVIFYTHKPDAAQPATEGWQVPYNAPTEGNPLAPFMNKPCIIKLEDGRLFLRTLKPGSITGRYTLTGYNCPDLENVGVAWAAKIVFIKT